MTYCVGVRLDEGLVFLSDSRTNAGVDHIGTFRKLNVFENPGDRVIVMMTAGNLSISQTIREMIGEFVGAGGHTIWTAPNMYEATRVLGEAVRTVHDREAQALANFGIDFNQSIIFGGQIGSERCRLFQVYSAGNFIESHAENTYFQIGESKYGKPILDRVITHDTSLDEAAKCALISMDSTLRSNISVGLPLDMLVYENNALAVTRFVTIDEKNEYFRMLHTTWSSQLKCIFEGIAAPEWQSMPGNRNEPMRMPLPLNVAPHAAPASLQSVAQQFENKQQ
ncbi:peptidase [Pseudoduganella plicata]|uniref:Peptidase n=1 Tax=Pseudoduganella plicata TaxID=321984 RepID=A0A4P7BB28_9BURK|nr:peptidase [Pseudoduganella plicata]QBQ35233.1 peptidase [Pseudoduganella plicata]GGZ04827.1 peptidase [Pseudoduganella plicata]